MSEFVKKFKSGDNVCLLSDNTKHFTVDTYHFQHPLIQQYRDDGSGQSQPIQNDGYETDLVWCISTDTGKKSKIKQDKLELIKSS